MERKETAESRWREARYLFRLHRRRLHALKTLLKDNSIPDDQRAQLRERKEHEEALVKKFSEEEERCRNLMETSEKNIRSNMEEERKDSKSKSFSEKAKDFSKKRKWAIAIAVVIAITLATLICVIVLLAQSGKKETAVQTVPESTAEAIAIQGSLSEISQKLSSLEEKAAAAETASDAIGTETAVSEEPPLQAEWQNIPLTPEDGELIIDLSEIDYEMVSPEPETAEGAPEAEGEEISEPIEESGNAVFKQDEIPAETAPIGETPLEEGIPEEETGTDGDFPAEETAPAAETPIETEAAPAETETAPEETAISSEKTAIAEETAETAETAAEPAGTAEGTETAEEQKSPIPKDFYPVYDGETLEGALTFDLSAPRIHAEITPTGGYISYPRNYTADVVDEAFRRTAQRIPELHGAEILSDGTGTICFAYPEKSDLELMSLLRGLNSTSALALAESYFDAIGARQLGLASEGGIEAEISDNAI